MVRISKFVPGPFRIFAEVTLAANAQDFGNSSTTGVGLTSGSGEGVGIGSISEVNNLTKLMFSGV